MARHWSSGFEGNSKTAGIEVSCKTWLSGSRLLVNHSIWFAHMFRTQGGDFGFPYTQSSRQVRDTKNKVKELFWNNKWDKQIHSVRWLVEKFWPVDCWSQEDLDKIKF